MIAYYEGTGRPEILQAVQRAAQLTIRNYRGKALADSQHTLMFVDVVERLYELTGESAYYDFGLQLCREMAATGRGGAADLVLTNLLNPELLFSGHGATTCESFRAPLWCAVASGLPPNRAAVACIFHKALRQVSPTGAPVSQEAFDGKVAHPAGTAYECCALKEWMTSLLSAEQKFGDAEFADRAEDAFFNAVQASRLPDGKAVTYCTRDNLYGLNLENGRRMKYSPCHEDVANCCAPNHTQISPLFVRNMWMRSSDGLAAVLYGPCEVRTTVGGASVTVREATGYPFENEVSCTIALDEPAEFTLRLRVPGWSTKAEVACPGAKVARTAGWILVTRRWESNNTLVLKLGARVEPVPANNGEFYLRYGPLFYALGIPVEMKAIKDYALPGFHDYVVTPVQGAKWNYSMRELIEKAELPAFKAVVSPTAEGRYPWDSASVKLNGTLINQDTGKPETVALVPMGCGDAKLRRCTFPASRICARMP